MAHVNCDSSDAPTRTNPTKGSQAEERVLLSMVPPMGSPAETLFYQIQATD